MKKTSKQGSSKMSTGTKVLIGAGALAVGAGAYAFMGPKGKNNRKEVMDWASEMKKEVTLKVKKLKKTSQKEVDAAIEMVAGMYSAQYKEHAPKIKAVAKALKTEWGAITTEAPKAGKKAVKKAAGQAKKTVKKTVKKVIAKAKGTVKKAVKKVAKK